MGQRGSIPTKRRRRWDIPKFVEIRRKATSLSLRRLGVCRRRTNRRQFATSYGRPTDVEKSLVNHSTFSRQNNDIAETVQFSRNRRRFCDVVSTSVRRRKPTSKPTSISYVVWTSQRRRKVDCYLRAKTTTVSRRVDTSGINDTFISAVCRDCVCFISFILSFCCI